MKDFESQIISMVRNLKIDADNREKLTDEKLKLARDPVGDYQTVREELEFFRNLIDALEEERKKDMLRSKQFVEEKAKDLYNDIELLRAREIKEVDKALDQTKYEVVEQLVESSDHQKRELREIRYEIDKNKEEIALMTNNIKNLRRRANEDMDRTEDRVIQKSDSNMLRTLSQQLEEQIDESMLKLRQDLRKDVELMIEDGISQNNENFVVPSIKSQTERNFDTFNMKKSHDEPKRVLVESPPPNERELRNKIDEILEPKCTQICRKIVDEELEVTKREIIDNEIEPICQKMMIEEYARSRRNIIDKEIEPKCREIIEEEAPAICEKEISKKLNTELKGAGVIRPVCKSIIEEEVSDIVNNAVKDEFTESRRMAIQNEIEPL